MGYLITFLVENDENITKVCNLVKFHNKDCENHEASPICIGKLFEYKTKSKSKTPKVKSGNYLFLCCEDPTYTSPFLLANCRKFDIPVRSMFSNNYLEIVSKHFMDNITQVPSDFLDKIRDEVFDADNWVGASAFLRSSS